MANLFSVPQNIITGENALQLSMRHIQSFGKKAFIVTDDAMVKLGNVRKLTDELDKIGITYAIYSGINSEPTHTMVVEGVALYKEAGCDFLVGIGGGSPMDSMKAIAALATNGGDIKLYMGKTLANPLPPTVTIPTTAGTGSEATKVAIITDTDNNVKLLLSDPRFMARLAVVDPIFTLTAPPAVTVATGVDALTHAIEAYTSVKAFPMSDIFAVSAVKKIFANLYEAATNGGNLDARREMATAALEAGIAFSNSSVTIVHGMSRPIGALFHIAHGLSNAQLLGVCLNFLKGGAVDRLCDLAVAVGVYRPGMTAQQGADVFVKAVTDLLGTLSIKTLQQCNVAESAFFTHIPKMAEDALASGSPGNTRRAPTFDDITALYKELWQQGV